MNDTNYLKLVRASALYDLVVTLPLATPWTAQLMLGALAGVHQALGLPGTTIELVGVPLFFANLLGSVVATWSILRLLEPRVIYGYADGGTRMLFSTWMLYYALTFDVGTLWLFVVPELSWGIAQLFGRRCPRFGEPARCA